MASSSKRPSRSSKKSTARQILIPDDAAEAADRASVENLIDQPGSSFEFEHSESSDQSPDSGKYGTEAAVVSAGTDLGELAGGAYSEASTGGPVEEYAKAFDEDVRSARQQVRTSDTQQPAGLEEAHAPLAPDAASDDPSATPPATSEAAPTPDPDREAAAEPSVLNANVGDQPSPNDALGFGPYVEAIASFLTNEQTRAPLTLSIEGEWGSGKSSFMLQLKNRLKDAGETTLDFNAWRHDKDDAMWAAFALEFVRKLSRQLPFARRWWAHLKLLFLRFDWQSGWRDLARILVFTLVLLALCALPFVFGIGRIANFFEGGAGQQQQQQQAAPAGDAQAGAKDGAKDAKGDWREAALRSVIGVGGFAGYFGVVLFLFLKLKDLIRNPLTVNLRQHVQSPDYNARVAFIEKFHEDFAKVVATYAGERKVFVFIDDLDRCEVPKAADLMQALNLMISDAGQLVFIIGMDREKVAAGLAVKYEKLLPYLAPAPQPAPTGDGKPTFDPVLGLEYGYAFIEKFIQLPFIVPQAGEKQVKDFLLTISGAGEREGGAAAVQRAAADTAERAPRIERGLRVERQVMENVQMLEEILRVVAPALDYNPRRLKQFINTFRLKTYIASRTGLFDEAGGYARLTPYKLGKFVAISLRWPLLLVDLDADRELLSKLQIRAMEQRPAAELAEMRKNNPHRNDITDAVLRWYGRESLMSFLRNGGTPLGVLDPSKSSPFDLSGLDINKLLQVSPLTKSAAQTSPQTPDPSDATPPRGERVVAPPGDKVGTERGWRPPGEA